MGEFIVLYVMVSLIINVAIIHHSIGLYILYIGSTLGIALMLTLLSKVLFKMYSNKNKTLCIEDIQRKVNTLITSFSLSKKEQELDDTPFSEMIFIYFLIGLLPIFQFINIYLIINCLRLIFRKDKDLLKFEFKNRHTTDALNDNLLDDISIIKKYDVKNSEFIEKIIKNKNNPYTQIINDNYKNLISILNDKEKELESTFDTSKKKGY